MLPPTDFKCSICAKGFDNRTSQLRHISYCQKSKRHGRSRKRACVICTTAKTHCDLSYPNCSRCVAKNLSCRYDQPPRSNASTASPFKATEPVFISALPLDFTSQSSVELAQTSQNASETPLASSLDFSSRTSSLLDKYDISFPEPTQSQNTRDPFLLSYLEPSSNTTISSHEVDETLTFDHLVLKPPKGFQPRTLWNHQFSLNRKYMICTLRSYPSMMLHGKTRTLPAFIHPQFLGPISRNERANFDTLSNPLENCRAIVQMWSVKNKGNAAFIWRAIQMEQERLFAECSQYDEWNTVAALQAIAVYILLRISENDDEAMDFDLPLVRTMVKLGMHTRGIGMKYSSSPGGSIPTWEGWVLAESLRRTITVLFLTDRLFDYSSLLLPHRCDGSELSRIMLPCARGLWQASSRDEWEREYALRGDGTDLGKHLTYGDLLNCTSKPDHTLDSWLEQLDDFGALVMAAANLRDE